ncbi:MAG: DUF3105 domain-containing protein [Actinobacteria bacterium]|nr:DUF3105 domain-containing protein [Actinomycetota bacterium]
MAGGGTDPRRMTKAERKEDARRRREEIQRQMARRRKNRLVVVAVAIAVALAIVAVVTLQGGGSAIASPKDLLARAADQEKAASCTSVQAVPVFDAANVTGDVAAAQAAASQGDGSAIDRDHVGSQYDPTDPPLSAYRSRPPTSGPHTGSSPGPLPAGVYDTPPDIYRAIHDLEHGASIVWYSPDAPPAQAKQVKDFFDQRLIDAKVGQDRVIVAPFDYPEQGAAGRLPSGVQMALVAWHRLETCGQVNLAAAFDFTSQYSAPPYPGRKYAGEAPEAGAAL